MTQKKRETNFFSRKSPKIKRRSKELTGDSMMVFSVNYVFIKRSLPSTKTLNSDPDSKLVLENNKHLNESKPKGEL